MLSSLCLLFLTLKKSAGRKMLTICFLVVLSFYSFSQSSPSEFQLFTKLCSIPFKTPHYSVKLELSHEFN